MADRVRIIDACKNFGKVVALKNAKLSVQAGKVVLVMGPREAARARCCAASTAGKPQLGPIWIDDDQVTDRQSDIRKIREEVGMVFQSFNLFPHLSALENIILRPACVKRISENEARELGRSLLARVGLSEKAESIPSSFPVASSSG